MGPLAKCTVFYRIIKLLQQGILLVEFIYTYCAISTGTWDKFVIYLCTLLMCVQISVVNRKLVKEHASNHNLGLIVCCKFVSKNVLS